jgi:hypothetical protein
MNYHDLIQAYFERTGALTWYWTVYIAVIGGVLAFSSFRLRPDIVTTVLVTLLYAGFAYKNLGAIEGTTLEREALLTALKDYPMSGPDGQGDKRVRELLEPTLQPATIGDVRYFHLACDLMTIAVLWVKEWRRKQTEQPS